MAARLDDSWKVIHWNSYDSPYASKSYLDGKKRELEARGELDVFKREYLAEYTVGGKNSVFPMFSKDLHMRPREVIHRYFHANKDRMELYWINDPGTSTVFASIFVAYWREKGQIIVLDEIYEKDKSKTNTRAVVDAARAKMAAFEPDIAKWDVGYDDAAVWFANELISEHKIPAHPVKKATREKEDGISLLKTFMMTKNAFIMSEACEFTAIEIENYIMKDGRYPKINDHQIDNLRYLQTFANVVLALGDNDDLIEDSEEWFDHRLERFYEETGLEGYIQ